MRELQTAIYPNTIFAGSMIKDAYSEYFAQVKLGDTKAYELIFKNFYQRLCNYAFVLLKDRDESEEIVQQLFITIWNKRTNIEIETTIQAYLYRATNNACLNKLKQQQNRAKHHSNIYYTTSTFAENTSDGIISKELEENILLAVDKLPEQCKLVFQLSRFEGKKYQEIADELNISIKTVENHIGKALKYLREDLKEYLPVLLIYLPQLFN